MVTGGPSCRDAIIRYLEQRYLPGLSEHIVTEHPIVADMMGAGT